MRRLLDRVADVSLYIVFMGAAGAVIVALVHHARNFFNGGCP